MSVFIVWVDRVHAKVFHFSEEKMERKTVQAHFHHHHTHRLEQDEKESTRFYRELSGLMSLADSILLMGPGLAKEHLRNYLCEHHPLVAKKIVGCETVDHPTDGQIADFARKYFQTHGALQPRG